LQFHIQNNNILAQEQFCFGTNFSNELATYNLINNILTLFDNKLLFGRIFCDLTKALDCVKHDLLLAKLEYYGINCMAGDLLKFYFNDRYQRVIIKNEYSKNNSDWAKITRVYHKVQYSVHCFSYYTLTIYHI
jgi:hypothetical protein